MNYPRAPRCAHNPNKRKTVRGHGTFAHCPFFVPAAPVKKVVRDWIEKCERIRLNDSGSTNGLEPGASTLEVYSIRVSELINQKPDSVKRNLIRKEHGILRLDTADAMLTAMGESFRTVDVPVLPTSWEAAREMVDAYEFASETTLTAEVRMATAEELLAVAHLVSTDPSYRPAVAPLVAHIAGGDLPIREDAPQVEIPLEPTAEERNLIEVIDLYFAEAA